MIFVTHTLATLLVLAVAGISFFWWKVVRRQLAFPRRPTERKCLIFLGWSCQMAMLIQLGIGIAMLYGS